MMILTISRNLRRDQNHHYAQNSTETVFPKNFCTRKLVEATGIYAVSKVFIYHARRLRLPETLHHANHEKRNFYNLINISRDSKAFLRFCQASMMAPL